MKRILKRLLIILVMLLWLVVSLMAVKLFNEPSKFEEKVTENKITQNVCFKYKINVTPCMLYPLGGTVTPEGPIFTNITDSINLKLDYNIFALNEISIEGYRKAILQIIADKSWKRDIILTEQKNINIKSIKNNILNSNYSINLKNILSYIEKVEEETNIRHSKYIIKIKPEIKGMMINNNNKIPVNFNPELAFELSGGKLRLITSGADAIIEPGKAEFKNEIVLENNKEIMKEFNFFGLKIPNITIRNILLAISILLCIPFITMMVKRARVQQQSMTEAQSIDKKYKNYLVSIPEKLEDESKRFIRLQSFKALLGISEQKDQAVLRVNLEEEGIVDYYLLDNHYVYKYQADNKLIRTTVYKIDLFDSFRKWRLNG